MKKVFLLACGLASACTAALAQGPNAEEQFLSSHGYHAVEIAPGVYEVPRDGGRTTRYAFGSDGAYYDLNDAKKQLAVLQSQQQKRALNDLEVGMLSDLQKQIADLQSVSTGVVTNSAIGQGGCGMGPGGGGASLLADDPSNSVAGAAVAVVDRPADLLAPAEPSNWVWTLKASSVIYLNSLKQNIMARESPAAVVVYGGAQGRNSSYAYYLRSGHTCYSVSTASISTTNACSSPNNYQSVTDSTPCP